MSHNDITGDKIATKTVTDAYRNNYDAIFGKKKTVEAPNTSTTPPCPHNAWVSTMAMPPGPPKCVQCGKFMKDIPPAELVRAKI